MSPEFSERYSSPMLKGVPTLGWLTSILLSLLTLSVFGTLRNYGPDSVVRRFHMAVLDHDQKQAATLVEPDFDSAPTEELWMNVSAIMTQYNASYEIQNVIRKPNESILVVRYQYPNGERQSLIWDVVRRDGAWVIDTRATALAARKLTNAPNYGLFPVR